MSDLQDGLVSSAPRTGAVGSDDAWRQQVAIAQRQQQQDVVFAAVPAPPPPSSSPALTSPQMTLWPGRGMNLGETITSDAKFYQSVPVSGCLADLARTCCPCRPAVKYRAPPAYGGELLSFQNSCTFCCCPWEAELDGRSLGTIESPGCCENGCCYSFSCCGCGCSWCLCSGTYTLQNFKRGSRTKYSIRRQLYPCWGPIEGISNVFCLPTIILCNGCTQCPRDSCSYCCGSNAVVLEEAIFPAMNEGDQQVGSIRMVETIAFPIGETIVRRPPRRITRAVISFRTYVWYVAVTFRDLRRRVYHSLPDTNPRELPGQDVSATCTWQVPGSVYRSYGCFILLRVFAAHRQVYLCCVNVSRLIFCARVCVPHADTVLTPLHNTKMRC